MEFNNRNNIEHKLPNGTSVWESRSVAVNAVILAKDGDSKLYVLISKRGKGAADFNGLWNVPAGYLDYDETTSEAMVREVREETGVNVLSILNMNKTRDNKVIIDKMSKEWGTNSDVSNNRQNVSFRFGLYFKMKDFINKIELTNEHCEPDEVEEIKWIPVSKIKKYDFAFGHDNLIKEFVKVSKKKIRKKRIKLFWTYLILGLTALATGCLFLS